MISEQIEGDLQRLNREARNALATGRLADAAGFLDQALALDPDSSALRLNRAAVARAMGDAPAALAAIDSVLVREPRSFLALLMKASVAESMGQGRQAAIGYGIAASLAPPEDQLDRGTLQALAHGRALHKAYQDDLRDHLATAVGGDGLTGASGAARRISDFIDQVAGRRKVYLQEPTHFHYPGLPSIEYYDRDEFPWLADLEAATTLVQGELRAVLADDSLTGNFEPYVQYPGDVPLDQWRELNHSLRWSGFHFYNYGRKFEQNCARCPGTVGLLAGFPQPRIPGKSPAAMFSVLKPRTQIPPHTGVANTRLVVHLPLIVPDGCTFRVGNETRPWREGQAWVFDDTIEHEARNDSDAIRIILLFDIWQPRLTQAERDAITQVMTALDHFNGESVDMPL